MKIIAVLFMVFALVIGIVPQFTDCASQGRALTLANGNQVPMKCHWTAQAEVVVAIPLFLVGGLMLTTRSKETERRLAILGGILGISAILLPTLLIGVCSMNEMICNMLMKPTLLLSGILTAVVGLAGFILARNQGGQTPLAG